MPPTNKKRIKNTLTLKQKKLLKVRLVKISMVIEDYLYKFKPVSTNEAKAYVEEVTNYKQQCMGDARSLQVIEKITRCMNSLITEQQEDRANSIDFQHVSENYCPSPVYSVAEEDGIMLVETPILNPNVDAAGKENNVFESIDLCDDENDDANRHISVEVEIHRAMSNLSITENNHTTDVNVNPMVCTQSILNDFNDNRAQEIKKTVTAKTPQADCNTLINSNKQGFDTQCSQSVLADFNEMNAKIVENSTTTKHRLVSEANNQVTKKLLETPHNEKASGNNEKEIGMQMEKKVKFDDTIEIIDLPKDNKNKKLQKRITRQVKNKKSANKVRVVKRKTKTNEVSQGPVNIFPNGTTDKFTSNFRAILPNETDQQNIQTTSVCGLNKVNNSTLNKSMAKIYNRNVEDDLSWVENIRYVREISADEFDSKYSRLADIFWENFALPNDWSENFDYFD